jgi:hypothetical protein
MFLAVMTCFGSFANAGVCRGRGRVTGNGLRLYSTPSLKASVVGRLKKGDIVSIVNTSVFPETIDGKTINWIEVVKPSGPGGWVLSVSIASVTEEELGAEKILRENPDLVLKSLYKEFGKTGISPGCALENLSKYFDPALTALLIKENTCVSGKDGPCGVFEYDPLSLSQDPHITGVKVEKRGQDEYEVSFKEYDVPHVVKCKMTLTWAGWKVSDMIFPDDPGVPDPGRSVLEMLSKKWGKNKQVRPGGSKPGKGPRTKAKSSKKKKGKGKRK